MKQTQLSVRDVSFRYETERTILNHITFSASGNDSIGLVGANGVGKSTLLKLLVGLYLEFDGEIRVDDIQLEKKTLSHVREKIGYVFQDSDSQLFMNTVWDDVAFAPRNYGLPEDEVARRATHALEETGILHLKDKAIYKLSGGEKKLASIATILSMTPQIIIMDEPSIALDPKNRRNLIRLLCGMDQMKIIASHDLDMILETCERTILMSHGEIIADGVTKDILTDRALLERNNLELPFCLQKPPFHLGRI